MITGKVRNLHILFSAIAIALAEFGCTNAKLKAMVVPFPTITLEIQNYCPFFDPVAVNRRNFVFRDIFVYNSSAYFNGTNWTTDYDRDGLPDSFEELLTNMAVYPISWTSAYTANDGYSDLVKVRSGIQTGTVMPGCSSYQDSDNDGLTDCEENFLGFQTNNVDTDQDGIPDYVEFRFGMNPLNPNDPFTLLTGDGYTDYQKAKWGIPVATYLDPSSLPVMTSFLNTTLPGPASNPSGSCYTILVHNIPILPVVNGNMIQIQAVEDNQYPALGGLNSLDREVRNHQVLIPQGIQSGVTIVIPDGLGISNSTYANPGNSGIVEGVGRPLIIVGGS